MGTYSDPHLGYSNCKMFASSRVLLYCCFISIFLIFASYLAADTDDSLPENDLVDSATANIADVDTDTAEETDDPWEAISEDDNRNKRVFTTLEEILAYEATENDYKTTVQCLESRRVRNYDVLSDRFILVHMRDKDSKYLIQLDRKCAAMTQGATLRFDSRRSSSTRVCANDSVRANMATEWGPPCRLPGFEPINDVQLEQLTRGIVTERVE